MTPRRLSTLTLSALLLAGTVGACPLVTKILTRPGAAAGSFEARLLEISDLMQAMFYDTGYDRAAAKKNSARALEMWMELYLRFYLKPPETFRGKERWKELMDSVTGPMKRIRTYAQEENFFRGHHQLRVLQDSLTEFYGDPPPRKAARLGPVYHTLETLHYIEGEGPDVVRERRARVQLLRDRFEEWLATWPEERRKAPAFEEFRRGITDLERAVRRGDEKASAARIQALMNRANGLVGEAVTLQWGGAPASRR